jgi:hypothetical protein
VPTAKEVTPVTTFGRDEFLTRYWDYKPGEHVTMLAPTQNGKTTTAFDLIQHLPKQQKPPVILVMKPRDKTIAKILKVAPKGYFRITRSWPPLPTPWQVPKAYLLWPKHTFDPDTDDVRLRGEFDKAIRAAYKGGDRIVMADETYGLINELKLTRLITAVHSRGAGMGVGLWCMTQKPTHIGTWAYSQAEHLFLGHDPDKRARDRFAEIGGVDPDIVKHYVANLKKYQWFYIRRTGPVMCIVDAK